MCLGIQHWPLAAQRGMFVLKLIKFKTVLLFHRSAW